MTDPRLYIVDDDPLVGELVALVGRTTGFEPCLVHDPATLANLVKADSNSAVVLDLVMPELDGLEILKLLGRQAYQGPILILSGMDALYLEAAKRSAAKLGLTFSGALSKPIDVAALAESIGNMRSAF